ncbi:MAG: hypothetical protein HFE49_10630 [Clostridia bacterium]|nr:hypothetical protein [Clostridia bacterium]
MANRTLKYDITAHFNRCNMSLNARLHYAGGHFCVLLKKVTLKAQQTPISILDSERKGQKGQAISFPFTPTQEGGELNGAIFFPEKNNTTSV